MSPSRRLGRTLGIAALALGWTSLSSAEVPLGEAAGWSVSIDGRVNAFVSHVWGDNRPAGLDNLNWVGFNESNSPGQADADNQLRKTRIRSGYVPSTLGFTARKAVSDNFRVTGRVEVGIQITNIDPAFVGDPTWMEPRAVFLDLAGDWGSVHAGRDLSLFPRQNLFMNYELGHGYGLGFPCSYEKMFGGACGHVGFGVLWPDFRAQIGYSTPKFGDVLQISVALLDPRTVPTYNWDQTPLPRVEGDAVADFKLGEGSGVKAWGNGFWQTVGTAVDSIDPVSMAPVREDFSQDAYGVGGGAQGSFGPFKVGVSGYTGKGMDGFMTFTFNPISIGQGTLPDRSLRRFRKSSGFLAEASFTLGSTWIMGGFGRALLGRDATDAPIETLEAPPLIRTQTGISAGLFHRIDSVVVGIDYFNASYAFDARFTDPDMSSGPLPPTYVDSKQTVHIVNSGVTLEW